MLRGTGAFRRLAMIWPQTWWGLPVGWARWGLQCRKRAHLCSVSAARGSPTPSAQKEYQQLHRLEGSQAAREPGAPGRGRALSTMASKALVFMPGCSRVARTAGLSDPRTVAVLALALAPLTCRGQFVSAELRAQCWT